MNPARHGPEFSTGITFNIRSFPRRVTPSRLKRAYSEESVRRCPFGNENEPGCGMWAAKNLYPGTSRSRRGRACECTTSVQKKSSPGIRRKISREKKAGDLLPGRLSRCFRCARRRFHCRGSRSFRGSGTGPFSRRRRRSRGSWSCRRSNSFGFLLARREKRGTGQDADVFLHN
jgi:hypothetical protein